MSEQKIFYKKRLSQAEEGVVVITERFILFHETKCFYFCVNEKYLYRLNACTGKNETQLQYARREKLLKRIAKSGSRIAFDTEEKAMTHLRMLKDRQLGHMAREALFINRFLESESLTKCPSGYYEIVPDSAELVRSHFVFE